MSLTTAPALLGEDETLSLIESVIQQSEAEGVFVSLDEEESALTRFSENQIAQNVNTHRFQLSITSYFGKRSATSTTTDLEPDAIARTLRRSEELARFAPEDPEWVPLLEPQTYDDRAPGFDRATATLSPLKRGETIERVCTLSKRAGVEGSGTLSTSVFQQALGNSLGVRSRDRGTRSDFSFTARIENGSSWSRNTALAIARLPYLETTQTVIDRAKQSMNPREIKPGVYPVIFNSSAFADLLPWIVWNLDARAADEGRSFMSRTNEQGKPIGNRVGEQLFSPLVRVQRDRAHPLLQTSRFFSNGLPNTPLDIIHNGIPQTLSYSRYWAQHQSKEPTGSFYPIVMAGTEQSLSDLIAQTERAILINRAWYVRYTNPRTLEVTGMTRDGTFWVENGQIAYPIKNLRFNQSLPEMLLNVDALSTVQRYGSTVIPGVRISAFNFSSVTDSV
ncbi:TldD/PmbA family protein [Lusitaniella coriacea]|uniref:TldD/PmbA family protein n=1 Tax=Lusitaniella coriacea TaxID=1983105 RepID=UPI003CECC43E